MLKRAADEDDRKGAVKTIGALLVAGWLASASPPARAEQCMAGWRDAQGKAQFTPVTIDFASAARFDPTTLPERTWAVMCNRQSLVPRPDDVRVLSELHVAFGIAGDGKRSLWISARAGRLQVTVDGGKLTLAEQRAVDEWLDPANVRFILDWNPR
jgi:hypothetical protein